MPRYNVKLKKTTTEYAEIEVEADDEVSAESAALKRAANLDWDLDSEDIEGEEVEKLDEDDEEEEEDEELADDE